VDVARDDVDEIERTLHRLRKQLAGLFKGQQVYMQDIVDIALQYQEHLKQLQAAQYQYHLRRVHT
jgi:hypothetical protein